MIDASQICVIIVNFMMPLCKFEQNQLLFCKLRNFGITYLSCTSRGLLWRLRERQRLGLIISPNTFIVEHLWVIGFENERMVFILVYVMSVWDIQSNPVKPH